MARRPYVHLAGDLSGWPKGFVPTPAALRSLDQYSSELVNGDEGGTWAPTSPIVIGPRGTPTITLSTVGSVLSGNIETVEGNGLDTSLDAKPGLVIQGGGAPPFQTTRTRTVTVGFTCFQEVQLWNSGDGSTSHFAVDPVTLGVKNTAQLFWPNAPYVSVVLPLRAQHRGATISSVVFHTQLNTRVTALPAQMPRFRVLRVTGNVGASLLAAGWYTDTAATVAAYNDGGKVRSITLTPDQNHTSLDPATHQFLVQVQPTTIGLSVLSATFHLTSIADMRQE